MTTWITICDTCKRDDWPERGMDKTDGEILAALIEARTSGSALKTRRYSCLMGCSRACNVTIQAEGKPSYTLGAFEPSAEVAEAIIAYTLSYSESASGQVPFKLWPEGVKGHFMTRHPPLPAP